MSDDLRNRVARAIAYSGDLREKREWSELLPETRNHYRKQADAALAEMGGVRVPSREKLIALAALAKHSQACDGGYGIVGFPAAEAAVDAILAAIEPAPVSVQEAARVLYDMPEADRMRAWKATIGGPPEFGKWFCIAIRAIAEGKDDD